MANSNRFSSVQSLSCVWLFVTPWTTARQASLSITHSWSLLKLMYIQSVGWCHPTISFSAVSFSSCLQSFPASGSFPRSEFFASGGQSIKQISLLEIHPVSRLVISKKTSMIFYHHTLEGFFLKKKNHLPVDGWHLYSKAFAFLKWTSTRHFNSPTRLRWKCLYRFPAASLSSLLSLRPLVLHFQGKSTPSKLPFPTTLVSSVTPILFFIQGVLGKLLQSKG